MLFRVRACTYKEKERANSTAQGGVLLFGTRLKRPYYTSSIGRFIPTQSSHRTMFNKMWVLTHLRMHVEGSIHCLESACRPVSELCCPPQNNIHTNMESTHDIYNLPIQ